MNEIKYVPIDDLQLLPNNPRLIKGEKFKKLCESIQANPKYFESRPILANNASGNNIIYAGNMRYKACRELGYSEVPCIIETLTDQEQRERTIRDNVELGEWDYELLANEWAADELEEWGVNIDFNDIDMGGGLTENDAIPEPPPQPVSKPGDLYILGEHILLCGDSTNIQHVERLMDGEKADMVFTDPPYNLNFDYNEYEDNKTDKEYSDWCKEWFNILNIKSDSIIITPGKQNLKTWFSITDIEDVGVWIASNKMSGGKISNLSLWEPIVFIGGFDRNSRPTDIFEHNVKQQKDTGSHTCPKIIDLIIDITDKYCIKNGSILDVFGGSGTTLIACEKTKRKCYMMELDPIYCDVIVKRWEDYTGKQARLSEN